MNPRLYRGGIPALLALLGLGVALWFWASLPRPPAGQVGSTATSQATAVASPAAPTPTAAPVAVTPSSTPSPTATVAPPPDEWSVARPARDLLDIARRFERLPAESAGIPSSPSRAVGDSRYFWLADQPNLGYARVGARLAAISEHAYFYVEDNLTYAPESLRQSVDDFERTVYPRVTGAFGMPASPGVDGDPRIVVFIGSLSGVAGYQSIADMFPRSINPYSNECEIIYVTATGVSLGSADFAGLMAHEFQHLVRANVQKTVDTWVNEGSSELAVELAGYAVRGGGSAFLAQPDTQLTSWADELSRTGAHYGAAYLFMSYFAERFGLANLGALAQSPGRGPDLFDNLLARIGSPLHFDDLFADWVVANLADEKSDGAVRYGYRALPDTTKSVTRLGPVAKAIDDVSQYAARYYALPSGDEPYRLSFKGSQTARLLATGPHSGRFMWWGNRADVMDARMTTNLDLSRAASATLRFWAWYDIEQSYDYAYIAVSTDGGWTWRTVPASSTQVTNPMGNNLGVGYSGKSGGGSRAQWVQEVADLTPFAGQQVQLRFEYITDDGTNFAGFAVDDIQVPEVGFFDDAEGNARWTAEGFVRTDGDVPQHYAVRLVTKGEKTTVEELPLDADREGTLILPPARPGEARGLVVAAMAPLTTERAGIELSLQRLAPTPAASTPAAFATPAPVPTATRTPQ